MTNEITQLTRPIICRLIDKTNTHIIVEVIDDKSGNHFAHIKMDNILREIFCGILAAKGFDWGNDILKITPYMSTFHKGDPNNKSPYWDYEVIENARLEREKKAIILYKGKLG